MTSKEYVQALSTLDVGLFSDRKTLPEAVDYLHEIIDSIPAEYRAAAYTGIYVFVNTIAKLAREVKG
jgi:hypothetical protein